ncbi:protocatechuate 3,4-dioxygenase subunit alpha [Belnapia sp. T18]|uniref:Protocatechuate 3,4-dioxygenase subunit alpha n=1 Tax=Belnapia arida TaxID=2804533 RepID=A0ABS1U6M2_9PROT|nr:protocatechuate 3,4-dioxygenase subunit alpha [Belnapia arida]MBL6080293.1 protocatechuate 3,4-dioxygenase subunit alpha [Belnapia arida]
MTPLSSHTIGPFFPRAFVREGDNDLTRTAPNATPSRAGTRIRLHGRVLREGGLPCVYAILEAWQADAAGRFRHPADPDWEYADPDFLGWGRAFTDADGRFEFHTLMPGGFLDRAPHVNLLVMASGLMRPVSTTLFFPQFVTANAADPVLGLLPPPLRPRLLAAPDNDDGYRFDIRLRGGPAEETPFFES